MTGFVPEIRIISPEIRFKKRVIKIGRPELGRHKPPLNIITVGSLESSQEENLAAMGEYLATTLVNIAKDAKKHDKKVAFDMPTGSSPKPFYEALKKISKPEDLTNVIFFGHEAEWPPAIGSASLDYENQRLKILQELNIPIINITEVGGQGNYVSMYQADLKLNATDEEIRIAALQSAKKHDDILENLLDRKDVISIGYYGVGVDGHGFGEIQNPDMYHDSRLRTESTFITPLEEYSLKREQWFLAAAIGLSKSGTNDLWENRGQYSNVKYLMGLGTKIMNRLDHSFHIYNSSSKYIALEHTLGSMKSKGEGEKMLGRFQSFADMLRKKGVRIPNTSEASNCHQIVQLILPLIGSSPESNDFMEFVRLIQSYFGLKTPVSMGILERANSGKSSTIILPANIVKGKFFEFLAK